MLSSAPLIISLPFESTLTETEPVPWISKDDPLPSFAVRFNLASFPLFTKLILGSELLPEIVISLFVVVTLIWLPPTIFTLF